MFQRYLTPPAYQIYNAALAQLPVGQKKLLERTLTLTVYEAIAKSLPKMHRPHCLILLKSADPILDVWLQDVSPHSRLGIEEALLRTLLSLQVK